MFETVIATTFTSIIKVSRKLNFKLALSYLFWEFTSWTQVTCRYKGRKGEALHFGPFDSFCTRPNQPYQSSTGTCKEETKWRTTVTRIWNESGQKDFMSEIKRRSVVFYLWLKITHLVYYELNHFFHEFCQKRGQELLAPGMKGVLVTCTERERLCIREAYNVLNEVSFCSVNAFIFSQWSQFLRPVIMTYFFVTVKVYSEHDL